jgi:hypothetical protein
MARKISLGFSLDNIKYTKICTVEIPDVGAVTFSSDCPEGSSFKCTPDVPPPPPTQDCTEIGVLKTGGNQDATTWKVVKMRDFPECFKVVDDASKNIATNFSSEAAAQKYIDEHNVVHNCPPGEHWDGTQCVKDVVPTGELDKFGVKKIHKDAPNAKWYDKVTYKRTMNNQSNEKNIPRDTFIIDGVEIMNKEITSYQKIDFIKEDQVSNKFDGGTHSDSVAKQGRCYGVGVKSDGTPHLEKEYPQHSTTPKFPTKVKLFDPNFKSIGKVSGKMIGYKVCTWITPKKSVHMELHVDLDGLKADGTPSNNFKPFWWAEDDGTWQGEPYLTNQGKANGGNGIDYLRIDHVGTKTDCKFRSVREIAPPVS